MLMSETTENDCGQEAEKSWGEGVENDCSQEAERGWEEAAEKYCSQEAEKGWKQAAEYDCSPEAEKGWEEAAEKDCSQEAQLGWEVAAEDNCIQESQKGCEVAAEKDSRQKAAKSREDAIEKKCKNKKGRKGTEEKDRIIHENDKGRKETVEKDYSHENDKGRKGTEEKDYINENDKGRKGTEDKDYIHENDKGRKGTEDKDYIHENDKGRKGTEEKDYIHENDNGRKETEENAKNQEVKKVARGWMSGKVISWVRDHTLTMDSGSDDIRKPTFWRACAAEFIGTMFYVFVGCGSWIETHEEEHPLTVRVSLTFGFIYGVILYGIRNASEGHCNPSVTMAMLVTRRISVARAALYMVVQCLGAIIGAAILMGVTSEPYRGKLGCNYLSPLLSAEQGFAVEFFITFLLVYVVFACYDKGREDQSLGAPFAVSFAVAALHLFAVPYTGASMNTARSLGPAMVHGYWNHNWIYWFGPLIGGTLGGIVYDLVFATDASLARLRTCILVTNECRNRSDMERANRKDRAHVIDMKEMEDYEEAPETEKVALKDSSISMDDLEAQQEITAPVAKIIEEDDETPPITTDTTV